MITAWMSSHRTLSLLAALLVTLAGVGLALVWSHQVANAAKNSDTIDEATIDMTCFPPPPDEGEEPGIGSPPPCVLPDGLDPKFISPDPSGQAHVEVKDDGTTEVKIDLEGLAPDLVITAWVAYFFPPSPPSDPVFDIFRPIGSGQPPVAGVAAPLAPTNAAFTEGLGREPNQFTTNGDKAGLTIELDYNLLQHNQGPLRNELGLVTQAAALAGSVAEQPVCCPNGFPAPRPQPIGASFLRQFDQDTGLPVLGPDGRPELVRSPVPAAVIALVVHTDETTHGISAGIPIPPIPGTPADRGDHYTLGLFDLRALHTE